MYVGDILRNKSQRAVTIGSSETISMAASLMRASTIGALVVRNISRSGDAAVVGMFCERDLVSVIAERGAKGLAKKVSQFISSRPLLSCNSQDTLVYAEQLMNRHSVRHLPVIDNGRLVGVISIRDVASAFDEVAADAVQAA